MRVIEVNHINGLAPLRDELLDEMRRNDKRIELLPPNPERDLRLACAQGAGRAFVCVDHERPVGALLLRRLKWESDVFGLDMAMVRALLPAGNSEEAARARGMLVEKTVARGGAAVADYVLMPTLDDQPAELKFSTPAPVGGPLAGMVNLRHALRSAPPEKTATDLKIRTLTHFDIDAVADIAAKVFVFDRYSVDPALPAEGVETAHRSWASECCRFCDITAVAEAGGRTVGFCSLYLAPGDPRVGVVQLVGVARDHQRRGIGRALMSAALRWFDGRVDSVVIRTESGNEPALRLYLSLGFEPYARFTYMRWMSATDEA